jgi:hypothetical protein
MQGTQVYTPTWLVDDYYKMVETLAQMATTNPLKTM